MDFEGETNSLLIISGLPFDNGKTIVEEHVINGSEKSNTFVKDFSLTLYGGIGGALKFKDLDHPVPIYCGGTVSGSVSKLLAKENNGNIEACLFVKTE